MFDWQNLYNLVDGSTAAILAIFVIHGIAKGRLRLGREFELIEKYSDERLKEAQVQLVHEKQERAKSDSLVYELTNEIRDHNKTNDKVIELLLLKGHADVSKT